MKVEEKTLLAGNEFLVGEGNIRIYGRADGILEALATIQSDRSATFWRGGRIHIIELSGPLLTDDGHLDQSKRNALVEIDAFLRKTLADVSIQTSLGTGTYLG